MRTLPSCPPAPRESSPAAINKPSALHATASISNPLINDDCANEEIVLVALLNVNTSRRPDGDPVAVATANCVPSGFQLMAAGPSTAAAESKLVSVAWVESNS